MRHGGVRLSLAWAWFVALILSVPVMTWAADLPVQHLIFASAGFHEGNRFWTIAKPDHLQFDPFLETLLEVDPKTAEYTPRLATKWSHSPDFKEWTFYLRKDVQFHFGFGPFTARDVVHSHSLMVRPNATATLSPFWRTVEEVKPLDDYTVVFRFKNPVPPATMLYAVSRAGDLRIVSKAQWDKEGIEGFDKRRAHTSTRGANRVSTSRSRALPGTGRTIRLSKSSSSASCVKKRRGSRCCSRATPTSPICRASCRKKRSPKV